MQLADWKPGQPLPLGLRQAVKRGNHLAAALAELLAVAGEVARWRARGKTRDRVKADGATLLSRLDAAAGRLAEALAIHTGEPVVAEPPREPPDDPPPAEAMEYGGELDGHQADPRTDDAA